MSLTIKISADSKFPVNRKRLRKTILNVWKKYEIDSQTNLSIAIVGTRKMAELHKIYLGVEGPTTVLAFPQQGLNDTDAGFINPSDIALELGDIVICYPLAVDKALKMGTLVDEQIDEMVLHGFRNIMGETEKEMI